MTKLYPEIEALQQYFVGRSISVQLLENPKLISSAWVKFAVNGKSWTILVDDEFDDLQTDNEVLALFMVLLSLQGYQRSNDFLEWCLDFELDASNAEMLELYRSLEKYVPEIEKELGGLDPYITSFDFHMNAGATEGLRNL